MTMRGIRLFAIGFVVLPAAVTTGVAQTNAVPSAPAKQVSAADAAPAVAAAAAPAPAPQFPKNPAELPPKPPKVACHGDQLTISADNSTLDAILFAVRGCTGAHIDVPGDAGRVRSFEELGPGPVREVLDQLLSGTPYNYVIQSSEANPLKVETVMLSMRTEGGTDKGGAGPNAISTDIPLTPGRRAWQKMQKFDKPDPATLNGDDTPAEADAATPADEAAAVAAANPSDANAAPASAGDASAEAAATTPRSNTATPANANPSANSGASVQERIAQMQQMFAQRQQQMQQKQSQPGAPNN